MTTLAQKGQIVGRAGSFQNQIMSNNDTVPVVGEYCTFLSYSDRSVGIVREWDEKTLTARVETCNTVADGFNKQHGHQDWKHEPSGHFKTLVFKNGNWVQPYIEVEFTKEFRNSIPSPFIGLWLTKNNPELLQSVYSGQLMPQNVIEGVTRAAKRSSKVNVIFGVCDYHYDWSF